MPALKEAIRKAAKKSAKHTDLKQKETKDLRRAFEHLGRLESLQVYVEASSQEDVSSLLALAQQELSAGDAKNAAELLRAAEHLSFAALAADHAKQSNISPAVRGAIEVEYEHLVQKAQEHFESHDNRHPAVASHYKSAVQGAKRAFAASNYRQALELARAAEALAHVVKHGPGKLTAGLLLLSLTGARK